MSNNQLIYVSLDLRRALWVYEAVGAKIICSYQADLLNDMRERGNDIWCFEEEYPDADIPLSTFLLLSRALTINMLRKLGKELRFIVFKPSTKIRRFSENNGWEIISSDIDSCRALEDKIRFFELAREHAIPIPLQKVILWEESSRPDYHAEFGKRIIVQGRIGHAGNCTRLIEQNITVDQNLITGARVKISEYIEGKTYTVNGYVDTQGMLAIGTIWEQIMGIKQWNRFEMGSVGVSPVNDLNTESLEDLRNLIEQVSSIFRKAQYSGFFGLDLIWDEKQWYLIECNARLTATVSLQCMIDIEIGREPILKLHAEKKGLDKNRFDFLDYSANFGQIIFRNNKSRAWRTPKTLKSGIYGLKKGKWTLKSRSSDARKLEEEEILLILSRKPDSKIRPGADFASIQFSGSAFDRSGSLDDRFHSFYENIVMGHLIREQDFWQGRYASLEEKTFLLRKPIEKANNTRDIQTEILNGEVLKLLGAQKKLFLAERADGTRGWLKKNVRMRRVDKTGFELPGKSSVSSEEFFELWNATPYLWGGNSKNGIDCSAFVQRYFWEVKGILLPKNSQDQKSACSMQVSPDEIENDDLIFLHSKTKDTPHVGIVRNGRIWHSSMGNGVMEEDLDEILDKYILEGFWR